MALTAKSLFLYGYEITTLNQSIDFRVVALETPRQATLTLGFYSLSGLLTEVSRALKAQASTFTFTSTADRTISSGTQNHVTIATSSAHFELLFGSGPNFSTTAAPILGFTSTDKTGATSYIGTLSSGTSLITDFYGGGKNYLPPQNFKKVFGSVNVSASGDKEAVVFQVQEFWRVQFDYEPQSRILPEWQPLFVWMIQQRPLEFTPEITSPSIFFEGTLESTSGDGKGLGYTMTEMLPNYPFLYDTGLMTFRKKVT